MEKPLQIAPGHIFSVNVDKVLTTNSKSWSPVAIIDSIYGAGGYYATIIFNAPNGYANSFGSNTAPGAQFKFVTADRGRRFDFAFGQYTHTDPFNGRTPITIVWSGLLPYEVTFVEVQWATVRESNCILGDSTAFPNATLTIIIGQQGL